MNFLVYDLTFFVLFSLFIAIFLYVKRKQLKREGIIYLYKSNFGLKIIDYIGKKYKKLLDKAEWLVIIVCYLTMAAVLYLLAKIVYVFLNFPDFVRAIKIPPIMPLIPYIPEIFKIDFLPPFYFTYWIVVLAITAIVHEFFHGIFSRKNDVRVKKTGFYFLGPFTGAFVEPDEKQVSKLEFRKKAAIFGAGSFSNWLLTIIFFLIMWGFFVSAYQPAGVMFNSYAFQIANSTDIGEIVGQTSLTFDGQMNLTEVKIKNETYFVKNASEEGLIVAFEDTAALRSGLAGIIVEIDDYRVGNYEDMKEVFANLNPGDEVIIKTLYKQEIKSYEVTLGERNGKPFLGIVLVGSTGGGIIGRVREAVMFFREPNTYYAPKFFGNLTIFIYNLLWWMVFINLSVALGNMLPLGIFDGGRFFYITLKEITKSEKFSKKVFSIVTYFLLFVFLLLMVSWAFSIF